MVTWGAAIRYRKAIGNMYAVRVFVASPSGQEMSQKAQKEEKKKLDLCLDYEKSHLKDDLF